MYGFYHHLYWMIVWPLTLACVVETRWWLPPAYDEFNVITLFLPVVLACIADIQRSRRHQAGDD